MAPHLGKMSPRRPQELAEITRTRPYVRPRWSKNATPNIHLIDSAVAGRIPGSGDFFLRGRVVYVKSCHSRSAQHAVESDSQVPDADPLLSPLRSQVLS